MLMLSVWGFAKRDNLENSKDGVAKHASFVTILLTDVRAVVEFFTIEVNEWLEEIDRGIVVKSTKFCS